MLKEMDFNTESVTQTIVLSSIMGADEEEPLLEIPLTFKIKFVACFSFKITVMQTLIPYFLCLSLNFQVEEHRT